MRIRTTTAVLVAAAAVPLALSAPAAQAATKPAAPYDFNGDGRVDLAIGAPGATVNGKAEAGAVSVVYGGSTGLKRSNNKLITQNTSGIPGSAEAGDIFGSAVASADLDRDGYAELLIGAPGEDVNGDTNGGTAVIVWGSASGLSGAVTLTDHFSTSLDRYGQAIAAGDFDGDGDTDVAVGATGSTAVTLTDGPLTRTGGFDGGSGSPTGSSTKYGAERLTAGDVTGAGFTGFVWHGRTAQGHTETRLADARIDNWSNWHQYLPPGQASAIGDIDGDGHGDIAVGNGSEPSADPNGAKGGVVRVVYGGPDGVDTTRPTLDITQATAGVPGAAETGDAFGSSVSLGDVNGDGYADLAVGAPGESTDSGTATGSVTVLYGSASGLTTKNAKSWTQATAGVPGASEKGDRFGSRVALTDHTGDGRAELTVSATGENSGDGAVWSLRGTATGLTATGATSFGPSATGVSTAGEPGYGTALND